MGPADRGLVDDPSDPIDRPIISLRSYIERAPRKNRNKAKANKDGGGVLHEMPPREPPSDWVLIFDCETRTTPDQRLRFGAYQLRYKGQVWERGAFFEPEVLSRQEQTTLRQAMASEMARSGGERIRVLTRTEFVDDVFYRSGFLVGAQIVGFNLPFDLSRLAIRHASARRGMRGGFSLTLSEKFPAVAVKHLSQRASLIRVTGSRPEDKEADDNDPAAEEAHESEQGADSDRGYFVDVKTFAAALTSESHTLASLSKLLKVATPKEESEEHGGALTASYVQYALRDAQTTWECFEALNRRLMSFELSRTGAYDLYSEASLGKAYLRTMNIRPWREAQPDFPKALIGHILSAYYGGRSEVHIRRQIAPIIHCDFKSMYPTVCTLMGLWKFVTAAGVNHEDAIQSVRQLLAASIGELIERLHEQQFWLELPVLVQVRPNRDLFPVRAEYPEAETATIGLNFLTSDEPQWFTLAEVLVAKILGGKTPEVVNAIRFGPRAQQPGLGQVNVAGQPIDAAHDDFYRSLIVHRTGIQAKAKLATGAEKDRLDSDQQAVKILANATSYGIFVELNVEDYRVAQAMIGYGSRSMPFRFKSKKIEKPGRYFHPLLATLITGAARLMLALAEYQVKERGLNWAFCDTDSIAIANTGGLATDEFKARALCVRDWFKDLNPYGEDRSILQLEEVNFPAGKKDQIEALDPPMCLAVSAKRYVLFNRDPQGSPLIRKASGHGLGHLMAPYDEPPPERRARVKRIGVPLWQEDLWKEVIRAAESPKPDETRFMEMQGFGGPAASQYAATTPTLLKWFDGYNQHQPVGQRVFPFGFLLSLQAKSRVEMAKEEPEALSHDLWQRREPRPAAPFFKRPIDAKDKAFDRERHEKIPTTWLKSIGRSLVRYHLHEESKFWGGEYEQRGELHRRHVLALAPQFIGKEADHVEESEFIGEDVAPQEHPQVAKDRAKLARFIGEVQRQFRITDRTLCGKAHVSHHTLAGLRRGDPLSSTSVRQLVRAAEALRREAVSMGDDKERWLKRLREMRDKVGGRNKLAKLLGTSAPYLGRVLKGEKPITYELVERVRTHGSVERSGQSRPRLV
jgi:hypothetical protein